MRKRLPVAALALGAAIVVALGACSSGGEDAPPSTDVVSSLVEVVPGTGVTVDTASTGPVPSSGIGSIDGPASVDPDFGGANPGGEEGGG